jgi:ubiquitin-like protein Pup
MTGNDRELFRIWRAGEDQTQKQRHGGGGEGSEAKKGDGGQKLKAKGDELKEEMDNLIDQIDDVLEENAEEFVKNYVQRGGQ